MAWLKRIKGRYYLYWKEDGKEHSKALGPITKREALRTKSRFETLQTSGSVLGPKFSVFSAKYVDWHANEHPDSHARVKQIINDHLTPVFGDILLSDITPEDAEQFKIDRSLAKAAPGTVIKEIRTLKAVLNRAVEWGTLQKNPIAAVKPPKEVTDETPPFYSKDELAQLYAASNEIHTGIWKLAANTGLRRRELMNLLKEDLRDNGIHVVSRKGEGKRTKSGKSRVIPWNKGAREAVLALRGVEGTSVIPQMTLPSLSRAFVRDAKRAELPGSLHWLRHTFASHLVMNDFPIRYVQKILGHSKVTVTEKYSHLSSDYMSDQMEGMDL